MPSSYEQKSVKVDKASVTVTNIPEGYDAVVTSVSSNSVTVVGKKNSLNTDSLGVGLVVDLSAYENNIITGSSDYDLTTSLENSENCWVYGEYTANVTITKK